MVTTAQEKAIIDDIKLKKYDQSYILKKAYPKPICYKQKRAAYDMFSGKKCSAQKSEYKIIETQKRIFDEKNHNVMILEAHKGYQFIRIYNVCIYSKIRSENKPKILIKEAMQYIFSPKGKLYFKRLKTSFVYYYWDWDRDSNLNYHKMNLEKYEFYCVSVLKKSVVKKLEKVHLNKSISGYMVEYIQRILKGDYRYETLVELKHFGLIKELIDHSFYTLDDIWPAVKIVSRNNYNIYQDANGGCSLWIDEIRNLIELNLDIHNPKYVCPKNLLEIHNIHNEKIDRKNKKEQLKIQLERSCEDNIKYIESHQKYFKNEISNEKLIASPLKDVKDFYDEATYMHHCVFSQEYYRKNNSLILSVRNKTDNSRLETCEIDLRNKKINQCYGKFDKFTEFHNQILSFINQNMKKITKGA